MYGLNRFFRHPDTMSSGPVCWTRRQPKAFLDENKAAQAERTEVVKKSATQEHAACCRSKAHNSIGSHGMRLHAHKFYGGNANRASSTGWRHLPGPDGKKGAGADIAQASLGEHDSGYFGNCRAQRRQHSFLLGRYAARRRLPLSLAKGSAADHGQAGVLRSRWFVARRARMCR